MSAETTTDGIVVDEKRNSDGTVDTRKPPSPHQEQQETSPAVGQPERPTPTRTQTPRPVVDDDTKKCIRAVLLTERRGMKVLEFHKAYRGLAGRPLDVHALGFRSLVQLLESIPDVVELREHKGSPVCHAVGAESPENRPRRTERNKKKPASADEDPPTSAADEEKVNRTPRPKKHHTNAKHETNANAAPTSVEAGPSGAAARNGNADVPHASGDDRQGRSAASAAAPAPPVTSSRGRGRGRGIVNAGRGVADSSSSSSSSAAASGPGSASGVGVPARPDEHLSAGPKGKGGGEPHDNPNGGQNPDRGDKEDPRKRNIYADSAESSKQTDPRHQQGGGYRGRHHQKQTSNKGEVRAGGRHGDGHHEEREDDARGDGEYEPRPVADRDRDGDEGRERRENQRDRRRGPQTAAASAEQAGEQRAMTERRQGNNYGKKKVYWGSNHRRGGNGPNQEKNAAWAHPDDGPDGSQRQNPREAYPSDSSEQNPNKHYPRPARDYGYPNHRRHDDDGPGHARRNDRRNWGRHQDGEDGRGVGGIPTAGDGGNEQFGRDEQGSTKPSSHETTSRAGESSSRRDGGPPDRHRRHDSDASTASGNSADAAMRNNSAGNDDRNPNKGPRQQADNRKPRYNHHESRQHQRARKNQDGADGKARDRGDELQQTEDEQKPTAPVFNIRISLKNNPGVAADSEGPKEGPGGGKWVRNLTLEEIRPDQT